MLIRNHPLKVPRSDSVSPTGSDGPLVLVDSWRGHEHETSLGYAVFCKGLEDLVMDSCPGPS